MVKICLFDITVTLIGFNESPKEDVTITGLETVITISGSEFKSDNSYSVTKSDITIATAGSYKGKANLGELGSEEVSLEVASPGQQSITLEISKKSVAVNEKFDITKHALFSS